jgi:CO/xanthine dehydrogenase Mo-binding subunit
MAEQGNPTPTPPTRLILSRRRFLQLTGIAGSGLVVAWSSACSNGSTPTAAPTKAPTATGKVEFGQGIQTGFAQLAAEELDVSFDRVNVIMGQTNRTPYASATVGSQSTRGIGPTVRQAAAEMHQWLLELGAQKFGVPSSRWRRKTVC